MIWKIIGIPAAIFVAASIVARALHIISCPMAAAIFMASVTVATFVLMGFIEIAWVATYLLAR